MSAPQAILDALKTLSDYLESVAEPKTAPPEPHNTVMPPYGVPMTLMTIFGLNYDGSDDKGDVGADGKPLSGAWGAQTHNKEIVGCALPIVLLKDTLGGTSADHVKGYTVEIYSQVTQKTLLAVDIVDEGPAAWTHRLIDGTYGLHKALGHIDYGLATYGSNFSRWPAGFHVAYWINDPNGKAIEIKGVDFKHAKIIGS